MDIQQDFQNQQGQCHQRYDTKNSFKDISSLDSLTDYAIGALTEKAPSYFFEYEKAFTKEIRNFVVAIIKDCKDGMLLKLSDEAIEEAVENKVGDVLDASCIANHEHFKAGIQFGALMVVQLLFWMDNFNNDLLLSGTTYRQAVSIWTKTEQT